MELNRFRNITRGYQKTVIAIVIGASLGFTALVASANSNNSQAIQTSPTIVATTTVAPTTTTTTTTIPQTTTTEVDWAGVAASIQLGIEEARGIWGVCGEWHDLAIQVGWPEEEWSHLQQVIYRESRCQADAWNGADAGLVQVNRIHSEWISQMGWSFPNDMFDAEKNLTFALRLWGTSGWRPWRFSGSTFGD